MGLPQQLPGETYPGVKVELEGALHVADDGCAYLTGPAGARLIIWPGGSTLSQPARLPDGTELRDGDRLEARGRLVATSDLPGGPDGYWAFVTGFCDAGGENVAVLDEVSVDR
jgi:hypothetical protein